MALSTRTAPRLDATASGGEAQTTTIDSSGQGGHTLLPWGRAAWVRSPPTPTHKTCLLSAVGDLK